MLEALLMMRRLPTLLALALLCALAFTGEAAPPPGHPIVLPSGGSATGTPAQQANELVSRLAPVLSNRRMEGAVDLYQASWQIGDALRAAPEEPRVQRLYGWLLIAQVRYAEAAEAFRKALAVDPHDQQAQRGLAQVRRLSRLIRTLPLHLKSGWRVFRLAEIPAGARPGVLVLVGQVKRAPGPGGPNEVRIASPEVRYFAWGKHDYRQMYCTRDVGGAGFPQQGDLQFARLWVGDFQRTGRPQALLVSGWIGADWLPTFVDIFEARHGTVRHILDVESDYPAEWVDLDHNDRPEVQTNHIVGITMAHADTGAWLDIYRYNGRRYVYANARYPAFPRDQLDDLLDLNQRFPHDPDVLAHIARAYRDVGQTAEARRYEQQAREAKQHEAE
jgi:tetratricopeptide (TPR) repeat protein